MAHMQKKNKDYISTNIMTSQELLRFGIEQVLIHEETLIKCDVIDISSEIPNIYLKDKDILISIFVKVDMYPNHPKITDDEIQLMRKNALLNKSKIYFAPISFYWKDGNNETENGWAVKNGDFFVNYKGLEVINI